MRAGGANFPRLRRRCQNQSRDFIFCARCHLNARARLLASIDWAREKVFCCVCFVAAKQCKCCWWKVYFLPFNNNNNTRDSSIIRSTSPSISSSTCLHLRGHSSACARVRSFAALGLDENLSARKRIFLLHLSTLSRAFSRC